MPGQGVHAARSQGRARSPRVAAGGSLLLLRLRLALPHRASTPRSAHPKTALCAPRRPPAAAGRSPDGGLTGRGSDGATPGGAQVSPTATFQADLGLDSLDTVELVMAIEEEFAIEIPDAEADKILSCGDAIAYLSAHPQAA